MGDDIEYQGRGKVLLCEIAEELNDPQNLAMAARVLNSVLYGVTNMLAFEDGIIFLRAIPLYAKGIHQWGWQVGHNNAEQAQNLDDLKRELRNINQARAAEDFPTAESTGKAVHAVFRILSRHIPNNRLAEAKAKLPDDLASLMESSTVNK